MLRDIFEGVLELLSPPTCAACESPLSARTEGFCGACAPLLDVVPEAPSDAEDLSAYVYGGPLAEAIGRLKYRGASHVAPLLAGMLTDAARPLAGRVELVSVVPLHPRRLRERGYSQSALLARPVARALGSAFRPGALRRVRDTPAQVGAQLEQRRQQLHGAFRASRAVRGRSVLVVDDVRTTGATLSEARRALLAAGASAVYTLALAERVRAPEGS